MCARVHGAYDACICQLHGCQESVLFGERNGVAEHICASLLHNMKICTKILQISLFIQLYTSFLYYFAQTHEFLHVTTAHCVSSSSSVKKAHSSSPSSPRISYARLHVHGLCMLNDSCSPSSRHQVRTSQQNKSHASSAVHVRLCVCVCVCVCVKCIAHIIV